ncbi:heme exporter protein CcmD [Rhodobacteraceae bacterium KN286]|uniref:Heme exporter protein D n=1 Tax=Oceanomicrobium pacificus TaxID=2692916 RepID=A0A6B0TLX1_9RHOB|nr:heme exporter protein CcmD [Oceanomicrobium pacificus]
MPELGKYAATVLSAYGVTLALVLGLVAASIIRARAAQRALDKLEAPRTDV